MIYYFKAIKSLVDTKAKNSLCPYPARHISQAGAAQSGFPYETQKGILILLTEVVEGNNGKDKTTNYEFFPSFSMTDCMINDTSGSQLFLEM